MRNLPVVVTLGQDFALLGQTQRAVEGRRRQ